MALSINDIKTYAQIAQIDIPKEQTAVFEKQINAVIDFAGKIGSANTDGTDPLVTPLILNGVNDRSPVRKDNAEHFERIDRIIDSAPEHEDNMFKVPQILRDTQ